MSLDFNAGPVNLVIPERRRGHGGLWALIVLALAIGAGVWLWRSGIVSSRIFAATHGPLDTLVVDEGELDIDVIENGSLESANNATVRCEVEALMGQVGGAMGATGQAGAGAGGRGQQGGQGQPVGVGGGAAGGQGGQGGQQGQGGVGGQGQGAAPKAAMPKGRPGARKMTSAQAKKAASPTANSPTNGSGAQAATGRQAAGGGGGAAGGGGGAGGGAAAGGGMAGGAGGGAGAAAGAVVNTGVTKPVIRSFSMKIQPHMPLRPKAVVQAPTKQQAVDPAMMGGRGGRGGGGRGGQQQPEKPGSTRIIAIVPEGTRVSPGDVVCELDSAAFKDEVKAQKIRYLQAEAWVKQAQSIFEVNEISLREYRDGIYPQDAQLIRQYLKGCEIEYEKAVRTADWSRTMKAKGYRAEAQFKADLLALQQWETTLHEARGMLERLEKYTAPRLITSLKAKNEAIRADVLTQKAAFELERERLEKLERMVAKCTLTAPRDGIVVYHNQSNRWGSTETQIQEGVTVREGQPIFDLPDPKHMQVRAKINETKVNLVHTGQEVLILLDAFPNRPMRGTVAEVMPISVQGNGMAQDVRIYYAIVRIEQGFDDLRPGLSAAVDFHVDTLPNVARVPVQAIREVAGRTFVAVPVPRKRDDAYNAPRWRWVPVKLGPSNEAFAQVLDGVKPGDKVLAHPEDLPAPTVGKATAVAQAR